jgi:D-amino-acid oxidase
LKKPEKDRKIESITIWTKDIPPNTTSNRAGGLIFPFLCEPLEKVNQWMKATIHRYQTCPTLSHYVTSGKYFEYFDQPKKEPEWKDLMPSFRRLTSGEYPSGYADGFGMDVLVIEVPDLLKYLLEHFRELGGNIVIKEVHNIDEAFEEFDIVCNCTGLGSRKLFNDELIYPTRGQVIRIANTNKLSHVLCDDEGHNSLSYVVCRKNDIVLGGTAQSHNWSLDPDPQDTAQILSKVEILSQGLITSNISELPLLDIGVGLRPSRERVRLETETYTYTDRRGFNEKIKFVVHNYGHGGSGFTVSWGCAEEAVDLVEKAISQLENCTPPPAGQEKPTYPQEKCKL